MKPELDVLTLVNRSMDILHPSARSQFLRLSELLASGYRDKATRTNFVPFETYRTAQRQNFLFHVRGTTKAKAFQSAHQLGLAVDFVPFHEGKFSWDLGHDWDFLKRQAEACQLTRPLDWDLAHIEHPRWTAVLAALRF